MHSFWKHRKGKRYRNEIKVGKHTHINSWEACQKPHTKLKSQIQTMAQRHTFTVESLLSTLKVSEVTERERVCEANVTLTLILRQQLTHKQA